MLTLHDAMQCLNDHLPPRRVHSRSAPATSSSQPRSAHNLSPTHRSASPRPCPLWAALLCLAFALTSVESVALLPRQSDTSSASFSSLSASSLDSLLALNSSVHHTEDHLHSILAPLTDDFDDQEEVWIARSRSKRDLDSGCHNIKLRRSSPKNKAKKHECYNTALQKCGRIFINAYNFAAKGRNKNDILVAQCTLRTAFFDCLKEKSNSCKDANTTHQVTSPERHKRVRKESQHGSAPQKPTTLNPIAKRRPKRFRECLAATIWDSRLCIFKSNIQLQ